MAKPKFDFSGYATKNNLKCTDGRVILKDAFKHNDGQKVPLVWQHLHDNPANVLGHAILENREDGVYAYCSFNETAAGKNAKEQVKHGDITMLSIYANDLKQRGTDVLHGAIREVSLVLAGANPGAMIDNLNFSHADGSVTHADDEAIIYTGLSFSTDDFDHADDDDKKDDKKDGLSHADGGRTLQEIVDSMSDEQREALYYMVGEALDNGDNADMNHSDQGGEKMKRHLFDNTDDKNKGPVLSHAQIQAVIADAIKNNGTFKNSLLAHATTYGIENIDVLFPDAQSLSRDPDWIERETGWVAGVLAAIHKSPFSRVKSVTADMSFETARAKGYIKATEKKEVYFKVAKRVTTPTTVYVKQKLDRDDIIDVVDFNIVAMARRELRVLLDEELARAALIGDGRDAGDEEKINEENIRPVWTDDDFYSVKEKLSTKTDYKVMIKEIAFSGERYKGSGSPTFYTTNAHHMNMLWVEDDNGRRIYESDATLCAAMGVDRIVEIPELVGKIRVLDDDSERELIGIKINLRDYNFGADKGGQIASFDDFDIDFNQYKYLMETRCSGALTKPKSAQIFEFETKAAAQG